MTPKEKDNLAFWIGKGIDLGKMLFNSDGDGKGNGGDGEKFMGEVKKMAQEEIDGLDLNQSIPAGVSSMADVKSEVTSASAKPPSGGACAPSGCASAGGVAVSHSVTPKQGATAAEKKTLMGSFDGVLKQLGGFSDLIQGKGLSKTATTYTQNPDDGGFRIDQVFDFVPKDIVDAVGKLGDDAVGFLKDKVGDDVADGLGKMLTNFHI